MEDHKPTSFTFEIDNFSDKEDAISSPKFLSGGCEWILKVFPKGNLVDDHLALFLCVANHKSLRLGWKRRVRYSYVLLNQSGKEISTKPELSSRLFCAQFSAWGWQRAVPLTMLQENLYLENNKLILKVKVKVLEVVDEAEVTGNEMSNVRGFQVLYSQVLSVSALFTRHPGFASNFKPRNQLVRTAYMNVLLSLIETLNKPPHSLSETELTKANIELSDLIQAGFNLDWVVKKLNEVSLKRKEGDDDGSRVQELQEQVKNLKAELDKEKKKFVAYAAKVVSLEKTRGVQSAYRFGFGSVFSVLRFFGFFINKI